MGKFHVFAVMVCVIFIIDIEMGDAQWLDAHATFYGDKSGAETLAGACGYSNTISQGYGLQTAALSVALFNNGKACGGCYEIMCVNNPLCIANAGTIKITATNICPASSNPSGNWCNPPLAHFDLTQPMFLKIAQFKAGIVPVRYRKVACTKTGGIKFSIGGNPNFNLVLVYNVGGVGDVVDVKIKGSKSPGWLPMTRNFGEKWQNGTPLLGQSLSFQVTTSDGRMVESDNVAPANWNFGQVFEGKNF